MLQQNACLIISRGLFLYLAEYRNERLCFVTAGLSVHLTGMVDYIQGTIQHYSKWNNWRELFVIPYRKEHRYKKKKSGSPGFIIERTVTVDKLKNIKNR